MERRVKKEGERKEKGRRESKRGEKANFCVKDFFDREGEVQVDAVQKEEKDGKRKREKERRERERERKKREGQENRLRRWKGG